MPLMRSPINRRLSSSGREFLFSLCPLQRDTRIWKASHRRPGLIINVISRGSVLSQDERERERKSNGRRLRREEKVEDVSSDKAIKREGIKRDKGAGVRATPSPGRHKGGIALSPLNFRKAQEYSSAVEKRICVTPRKKIELVRSAKE
ncbi:hypothetical protein ALC60_11661 [Trachymyrmex zeteki]|uniref:Uncharacterized protein n=1 Tax=Mycetomoellerius zeteki TaxID=64791 RepID=A0A151WN97_9HYME|nr:hypothetical protein ALC60_11661 [Trachymyrmex zeteki]